MGRVIGAKTKIMWQEQFLHPTNNYYWGYPTASKQALALKDDELKAMQAQMTEMAKIINNLQPGRPFLKRMFCMFGDWRLNKYIKLKKTMSNFPVSPTEKIRAEG